MESDKKREPIKVTDRRAFTPDGQRRSSDQEVEETVRGEGFRMSPAPSAAPPGSGPAEEFNSFVLSLASTAFIYLGRLEDPASGRREVRLEAARQMIDIIDMLRAKTRGNLEPHETEFLEGILYELKMGYASAAKGAPEGRPAGS